MDKNVNLFRFYHFSRHNLNSQMLIFQKLQEQNEWDYHQKPWEKTQGFLNEAEKNLLESIWK